MRSSVSDFGVRSVLDGPFGLLLAHCLFAVLVSVTIGRVSWRV
jgi:hypothetical protein